ncbi:hypothetical protein SELMODRAFT_421431 [Selaginella moellendorffii]|uniref:Uncharacterized protein CYP797H2 n=1 Tax=Selaginella moellendorffii TaxID=88036 RepID=D8SF93_SELML|nr:flavonoid 3'-monooxygenase [Selaginella moellendorffii]EFJ17005.1 hypothetical protein SELMODRAFT_421431 [Selaginella moellendorffii]|eukprot:XP_002981912.1 flavonoid 3'-monooxygenase [Selaginella moellendorffii]
MEFLACAIALVFFIYVLVWGIPGGGHRRLNLPVSPSGSLPLIGHLHLFGRKPHLSLLALSNKYGPIFSLRLGMVPSVVVASAHLAKELFKTQDVTFSSRPYFMPGEYSFYNFLDMGFAPYGDYWKNMRKLCATELFTIRRIDSFLWVRTEELREMLSALLDSSLDCKPVNMRDMVTTCLFNVVTRILMSKRFYTFVGDEATMDDDAREFKSLLLSITDQALDFHISEFVPPWLRGIDWKIPRLKKLQAKIDSFLQKIVDEHKLGVDSGKEDFMHIMLEYLKDEPYCEDSVKANSMELISGGTDTSAAVIEWAILELLHHPEMLRKAQEEMDVVVGNSRLVGEADIAQLQYMQAVIKETFRLHPPIPLLPRMASHDCKLGGFDVPKGATTFLHVYAIGRDPAVWDEPLKFMPERFLGNSLDVKGQDYELLPFGSGRRGCPGMILGLRTVQLLVSNLIHSFDWSFAGERGGEAFPLEERDTAGTVIWTKTPLQVVATPRLRKEVLLG